MQSFVFDYYGYNVKDIQNGHFDYDGYRFNLLMTTESEENIKIMNELIELLRKPFNDDIVYFVKNRYGQYLSLKENSNILLLTYKIGPTSLDTLIKMNTLYQNVQKDGIKVENIIELWEQRIEYLENQCLVTLNFDKEEHQALYENVIFAIGIAENAIQYLSDLRFDYQESFVTTLTHRRLKTIDKWEFFNPFNLVFDHSSRGLAELYRNGAISLDELIKITNAYQYSVSEYQYLLARILFPVAIFDVLEDIYLDNNYDYTTIIYQAIEQQNKALIRAKDFYLRVNKYVNIRPIRWLELI